MPGGLPLGLEICNANQYGFTVASTIGTTITAGAANTFGAWVQLTASSTADCVWLTIFGNTGAGTGSNQIVEIGVGASSSEKAVARVLFAGCIDTSQAGFSLPVCIPSGTRISARNQSATASDTLAVYITTFDGAFTHMEGAAGVDLVGASLSTSLGTAVTPSATADTKGAYAQLIASTARDYMGFCICVDTQNANASANAQNTTIDIAIGAGGSEQIIVPNWCTFQFLSSQNNVNFYSSYFPIPIPSGTRVAARSQCEAASATAVGVSLAAAYQ